MRHTFQSRSGFSIRRDVCRNRLVIKGRVSIPFWVFYPSRLFRENNASIPSPFQSRSGFSIRRDLSLPNGTETCWKFQSRSGFSIRRDKPLSRYSAMLYIRFNPVLGFLSVATSTTWRLVTVTRCFNPVLGFLSVATNPAGHGPNMLGMFQSRSGFSIRRDQSSAPVLRSSFEFQSRSGFSIRRDWGENTAIWTINVSPPSIEGRNFVDPCYTVI